MLFAMKTDLLLVPMGATYADMRVAALAAAAGGFDDLWTWDHLRPDTMTRASAPPECSTVLSALAEVVPRMMLGPLVLNVANRHPGLLANMAATLQQVSGGRLMLGIGAGGGRGSPYAANSPSTKPSAQQTRLCWRTIPKMERPGVPSALSTPNSPASMLRRANRNHRLESYAQRE